MSIHVLIVFLCAGASALALWLDARFPRLAPRDVRATLTHIATAFLVAQAVLATNLLTVGGGSAHAATAALLGIALPLLTYQFLTGLWIVKLTQGIFRAHGR